jgi:hypothetical protein
MAMLTEDWRPSIRRRAILQSAAACALAACTPGQAQPPARDDRLLMIALNEARGEDWGEQMSAAQAMGVRGVPFTLFWDDIERAPGRYAPEPNWAAIANRFFPLFNLRVSFVVSVLDTTADRRPEWLRRTPFDSRETVEAWARFYAWLRGQVPDLTLESVAIGNEIDIQLGDDAARWRAFETFWREAAAQTRAWRPGVPVGTKLTWGGAIGGQRRPAAIEAMHRLVGASERMIATYYPLGPDMRMRAPPDVHADIARLVDFNRTKPLELAEIGYSADTRCAGTPERQAEFVREAFAAWDENASRMPVMSWFAWTDMPQAEVRRMLGYYGIDHPHFAGFLSGLGLRDERGRPRPAYAAFSEEARRRTL